MSLDALYAGPGVGFESPMEMLEACHGRVRRTLDLMVRLEAYLAAHGPNDQARSAASDILRYFDIAGPAHHEDEERHVLPRLRASGDTALRTLADRLHADHDAMHADWQQLRQSLLAIRDGEHVAWPHDLSQRYLDRYAAHIEAEEQVAFPAARQGLTTDEQAVMGQEMAGRRQPGRSTSS